MRESEEECRARGMCFISEVGELNREVSSPTILVGMDFSMLPRNVHARTVAYVFSHLGK